MTDKLVLFVLYATGGECANIIISQGAKTMIQSDLPSASLEMAPQIEHVESLCIFFLKNTVKHE